jgi:hypothetical protein
MNKNDVTVDLICHWCGAAYTNDVGTLTAAVWRDDEPTCEACELD